MIWRKMRGSKLGFLMIFLLGLELGLGFSATVQSDGEDGARLMAFKKSSVDFDTDGFFADWNNNSSDPCSWTGVVCSGHGGITSLNLTGAGITGRLDLTALMAIPTLTALHFSHNFFYGNLSFASQASCPFQTLDLSFNNFSHSPAAKPLLLACHRLVSLDLSGNQLADSSLLSAVSLIGCNSLIALNFSGNKLTGNFPASSFSSCRNLSSLDVSGNHLSSDIPTNFPLPPTLTFLDLSRNNFTGIFQTFEFQTCQNLLELRLAHNDISGTGFPVSLSECRNLETLDVSYNVLSMEIPGAFLGSFKKLKKLALSHNQFSGQIPPELGDTCASLEELDLSGNRLTGELPPSFISCSSLSRLNLGHNNLSGEFLTTVVSSLPSLKYLYAPFNNISGSLPLSLANCSQLQVLDLSSNEFTGAIPPEICTSKLPFTALERMLLPNNYLSGSIPSGLGSCKNLRTIDLSFNDLTGSIPLEIWSLPSILDVIMWANNLSGEIPEGICTNGGGNLQTLILNNNVITGTIPRSIISCTDLIWVSLSSNRLTGDIPEGIGNLSNLAILQLGNNSLSGEIPSGLGDCKNLIWLDLNSNSLSGTIPTELANGAGLVLPGPVSGKQFAFVRNEAGASCRGAGGLIEFEGIRVDRLESFPMVHSCPSTRIYTGTTVYTFERNGSMIYLDLSYNTLSGTIPETFGSLSFLQVLNLGHNNLTGNIPFSLGDLKAAGVLDLSHNNLQGFIPGSLGGLSFLSDLDVSNNNLTGPIPSGGQLTTFPASRYENNTGLCGLPLLPCRSSGDAAGFHNRGTKNKNTLTTGVVVGITMSLLIIVMLMLALFRLKTRKRKEEEREKYIESLPTSGSSSWKLSSVPEPLSINIATFEKPLRKLTFGHLVEATNGFSADSLIGSGGFGDVYKARLKDGCIVAIKKLIHATSQGDREFVAEMETIGKIKHRNLVPLMGYCKIGEERLLVYEYMKWGSLESVLHERVKSGAPKLDWASRKKIAIGSARGLAFLHHSCLPHIIHRDMKSSNVLLDEDFEARVSDFGMARLVNALDTHLSVSTLAGTPGYVPPEYYQSFRCTTKGDVYSYGVILLELVSGKKPIDPLQFGDDNNLVGWAKQLQREKRTREILDPELLSDKSCCEAELLHYLKICFQCLDDKSWRRPTMIQVMTMFKELQEDSGSDILDGLSMKSSVIDESQEKEHSGDTNYLKTNSPVHRCI